MGVLKSGRASLSIIVAAVLAAIPPAADADATASVAHSAYEIESAMLYNFTKFVEWPEGVMGETGAPLVVGVAGDDAMVSVLETTLHDKTLYGHPILVRRLDAGSDLKGCVVLYVGAAGHKEAARLLLAAGRAPILTVGENQQFSRQGGVIAFVRDGNRIRFEINLDAAERARLQISSKLLRLATIWREGQARN